MMSKGLFSKGHHIHSLLLKPGLLAPSRHFTTSPFPFRPGYGLGSFIPPEVIAGMEKEADLRARIVVADQIMDEMEASSREINLEFNKLQNEEDSRQNDKIQTRTRRGRARRRYDKRNERYTKRPRLFGLAKSLQDLKHKRQDMSEAKLSFQKRLWAYQMTTTGDGAKGEGFTTFNAGAMSAVDWQKTKIVYKDRANDSLNIDARFFNFDRNKQSGSSYALGVAAQAAENVQKSALKSHKAEASLNVSQSVAKTAESRTIESTLLLTATCTHRKVQQFDALHVDTDLLANGWNATWGGLGVGKTDTKRSGGRNRKKSRRANQQLLRATRLSPRDLDNRFDPKLPGGVVPKVSMVTECFLGSALIGMVHFLKKTKSASEQSTSFVDAYARVQRAQAFGAISRDASIAVNSARKASNLVSQGEFDVKFDLVCLGYTPTIKSQTMKYAIKSFKDFDPGKFVKEAPPPSSPQTPPQSSSSNLAQVSAERQSNMKSVVDATVLSLSNAEEEAKVLDMNAFMNAMDNYCENAPNKEGVGIPIGLNVKSWVRSDIAQLLWQKYIASGLLARGTANTRTTTAGNTTTTSTTSTTGVGAGAEGEGGEGEG